MWRDEAYLLDMLLAARKVREFTTGVTRDQFLSNQVLQHAVMRLVQIIGEAARKISPDFKRAHDEVPWRAIVAMRHRLVHDYVAIIPEKVWGVVESDIPALIPLLEPMIPPEAPEDASR